jgi:cyanophycinase
MPIGEAEETEPGGEILERLVDLAGGTRASIAIIPTAFDDPKRSGEGYASLFREMGACEADWLRIGQRTDANQEEARAPFEQTSGNFITGGDQARLVELLVGTPVMESIRLQKANGVIVATPASPPKPCGRSPGRPTGSRSGRATRFPALRKAA